MPQKRIQKSPESMNVEVPTKNARIRMIFLEPRSSYSFHDAAALLGASRETLWDRYHLDIFPPDDPDRMPLQMVIDEACERWSIAEIEDALEGEFESIFPALARTERVTVRLSKYVRRWISEIESPRLTALNERGGDPVAIDSVLQGIIENELASDVDVLPRDIVSGAFPSDDAYRNVIKSIPAVDVLCEQLAAIRNFFVSPKKNYTDSELDVMFGGQHPIDEADGDGGTYSRHTVGDFLRDNVSPVKIGRAVEGLQETPLSLEKVTVELPRWLVDALRSEAASLAEGSRGISDAVAVEFQSGIQGLGVSGAMKGFMPDYSKLSFKKSGDAGR